MPLRVFRDSAGVEWTVWDVYPQWTERRLAERRKQRDLPPGEERRTGSERRVRDAKEERPRVMVSRGLEQGWITFESVVGRRRLAPIPSGWEEMRDAALEELLKQAVPLPTRSQRLIE